jgi:hypothetical protein
MSATVTIVITCTILSAFVVLGWAIVSLVTRCSPVMLVLLITTSGLLGLAWNAYLAHCLICDAARWIHAVLMILTACMISISAVLAALAFWWGANTMDASQVLRRLARL